MSYCAYIHTNKVNNKKYIGITSQKASYRWKNGAGYKKQRRFYNAIKCYGWDNFIHEVVADGLTKEQAEQMETDLIKLYKSNDPRYGYNIENGGVTNKISDEQKKYLSEINTGKRHTEETKAKMSRAHAGMSSKWLTGRKLSDKTKAKMGESRKGTRNGKARPVYQYALDGTFIRKYDYMEMIKEVLGVKYTAHISACCNGERGKAYGYMWDYELKAKEPYTRGRKAG